MTADMSAEAATAVRAVIGATVNVAIQVFYEVAILKTGDMIEVGA